MDRLMMTGLHLANSVCTELVERWFQFHDSKHERLGWRVDRTDTFIPFFLLLLVTESVPN